MLTTSKAYLEVDDFMARLGKSRQTTYLRLKELEVMDLVCRDWKWNWNIPRYTVPEWLLCHREDWMSRPEELIQAFEKDLLFGPYNIVVIEEIFRDNDQTRVHYRGDSMEDAALVKLGRRPIVAGHGLMKLYEKETSDA